MKAKTASNRLVDRSVQSGLAWSPQSPGLSIVRVGVAAVGAMEDILSANDPLFFYSLMLAFGAGDEISKVESLQPQIEGRDHLHCAPQSPFSVNSQNQEFKRFECSQSICGAMSQLQATHLFGEPCAPLFHTAHSAARAF